MMYQIPGHTSTLTATRSSMLPRVGVFVLIWLLLLVCYGLYRLYGSPTHAAAQTAQQVTSITEPHNQTSLTQQDCSRHAEEAVAMNTRAESYLRQSQTSLKHLLKESGDDSTTRRLAAALGRIDAAQQDLSASCRELELIESTLQGENKQ